MGWTSGKQSIAVLTLPGRKLSTTSKRNLSWQPSGQELNNNDQLRSFLPVTYRVGDYKLIWGSRTNKTIWFDAGEDEVYNRRHCDKIKQLRSRTHLNHNKLGNIDRPRGVETKTELITDIPGDVEYWDGEVEEDEDEWEEEEISREKREARRRGKRRRGRGRKKNKNKRKKYYIPNRNGVRIKPYGRIELYNLKVRSTSLHSLVNMFSKFNGFGFKDSFPKNLGSSELF